MVLEISTAGLALNTEGENTFREIFTLRQGFTNHGHQDSVTKYILRSPTNICVVLSLGHAHATFLTPRILTFFLDLGEKHVHLRLNTLRTGLLNCLNARSWGLTFRHRASCI